MSDARIRELLLAGGRERGAECPGVVWIDGTKEESALFEAADQSRHPAWFVDPDGNTLALFQPE